MIIYYDSAEHQWFHTNLDQTLTFGIEKIPLSYRPAPCRNSIPFEVCSTQSGEIGPLVAILAGRNKEKKIVGNKSLFYQLQRNIHNKGGVAIIATPWDIEDDGLNGFLCISNEKTYTRIKIPYPHIIYNRVPFRSMERSDIFEATKEILMKKGCCFFNPGFLDKYTLYKWFKEHSTLKDYFPDTLLINDYASLKKFLQQKQSIYVKPSNSSKGKGIYRLRLTFEDGILLEDGKSSTSFQHFEEFWSQKEQEFQRKRYIAQEEITARLHQGKRYDFRILVHYAQENFTITGVGIRQSQEQDITTHIPNGGSILPYAEVFQEDEHLLLEELVGKIGMYLHQINEFHGEFSLDASMTVENKLFIYEINSKPMRFDEIEIEEGRIQALTKLFQHLFQEKYS